MKSRLERLRRRQRRVGLVDAGVNPMALGRVAGLRPFALRPHEIGEPRAIDELVDHPRRNERGLPARRRRREMELELVVGRGHLPLIARAQRCESAETDVTAAADRHRSPHGLGKGDNGVSARILLEISGRPIGARPLGAGENRFFL